MSEAAATLEAALRHPLDRASRGWWLCLTGALALCVALVVAVAVLLSRGVGVWGLAIPVAWGFDLTNYVWWIGIGMAGTFISAALALTRQRWRTPLARYAEAMTVCAVAISGLFPILHLGRPWLAYWLLPYPDRMQLWPQWRSALVWDFYAILAYLLVSLLYFYSGLIPDLATLRDRARRRWLQHGYGLLALGWRGEARQWQALQAFSAVLAALAVPLVFSVHSMVALDFSQALTAGWHSTLFPPFFVAGALLSGFAMALLLAVLLRAALRLRALITLRHLDLLARLTLAAGLVVAYCYAAEFGFALHGGDHYEVANALQRLRGDYAWSYWAMLACNVGALQLLWLPRLRRRPGVLALVAVLVLVGMWLERFMLIVTSLSRDFLPARWGDYLPTVWEWLLLLGTLGLFALLMLLFVRRLPVVPLHELRKQLHETGAGA